MLSSIKAVLGLFMTKTFWGTIFPNYLTAVGTIGAVVVSLYLAQKTPDVMAVQFDVRKGDDPYLFLNIVNTSDLAIGVRRIRLELTSPYEAVLSEKLPQEDPGEFLITSIAPGGNYVLSLGLLPQQKQVAPVNFDTTVRPKEYRLQVVVRTLSGKDISVKVPQEIADYVTLQGHRKGVI
jgi:hypothetical protein